MGLRMPDLSKIKAHNPLPTSPKLGGGETSRQRPAQRDDGFALMIVLWVVAIMGIFTMLLASQTRLSLKMNHNAQEGLQAKLLAEAGVHRFIAELQEDWELSVSDHENETWFSSQSLFFDVPLGDGIYRLVHQGVGENQSEYYGGVDECSKLNLNTATKEMLMQLPNATEEMVDAIIDWRDENDTPETFGAETPYYQSLVEPYRAKNDLFDTVPEVLLVKGITMNTLFGEDTNRNGTLEPNENDGEQSFPSDNNDGSLDRGWWPYITAYSYEPNESNMGTSRININEADRDELEEEFGETLTNQDINNIISEREDEEFETIAHVLDADIDEEKWKEIADRITVSDEDQLMGRINLNTASRTVLRCLFPQNEEIIEGIFDYRESNDGPFENVGQLLDVEGIDDGRLQEIINHVCTKSAVFSVRSVGYLERSKAYKQIYAIIDRGQEPPQIIYWKEFR